MMRCLRALLVGGALLFLGPGCGGDRTLNRPVEVFFFVRGATGTLFEVASLEAANAVHDLGSEEFQTPYTFAMYNAEQVVRGTFRNLDPQLPITVTLVFATDIVNVQQIPPGACCVVTPGATCISMPSACDNPPPPVGREVRFDVTAFSGPSNLFFQASVGDSVNGTYFSDCVFTNSTTFCQTPASFFLEGAEEEVAGIFTKVENSEFDIGAMLYVDDVLTRSRHGRSQVILSAPLD